MLQRQSIGLLINLARPVLWTTQPIKPPSLTLSWICSDPDSDTLTYDVFFGTSNPPTSQVATGQSGATLSRTGLSNSTTYYWKVNATDSKGATTPGAAWSFTTSSGMPPPGMVLVTGGTFQMGSASGESNEQPVHAVTLGSYYLDSREVTYLEYDIFCKAKGRSTPGAWGGENAPICNMTIEQASEYAEWVGKRSSRRKLNGNMLLEEGTRVTDTQKQWQQFH